MSAASAHLRLAVLGLAFGFAFSCMGFTDFVEVHKMFTFQDLRLFLTFCGGVGLSMVGFFVLARGKKGMARSIHRGTIIGGVLFGVGWAMTGACPSGALVQLGEGKLIAFATLAGILVGAWAYPKIHRKLFRWPLEYCEA
jgi:uncharacterized membrane protein YedE/YeeE